MSISVSTAASRITANAAAVATAMAGGTTTGEATALAAVLTALGKREDIMAQLIRLAPTATVSGSNAILPA